jgi:hypothetical protein
MNSGEQSKNNTRFYSLQIMFFSHTHTMVIHEIVAMKYCLFPLLLFYLHTGIAQTRYDIVINEIMADPSPSTGLPENEWIELKNASASAINLRNWRIGDGSGLSGAMPSFLLQPDSLVIICSNTAGTAMLVYGATISVSNFPSLGNEGDQLILKAADGSVIHAVSYSSLWYRNELKKEGGWTLEMIDAGNPCSGYSNWQAGTAITGGTPGQVNSLNAENRDTTAPQLKNAYCTDSTTIVIVYNEPVDSLNGATTGNYSIDNNVAILKAITLSPFFNEVQLTVNTALQQDMIYTITVSNTSDCKGNIIDTKSVRTGLPATAASHDLAINEILFNPKPNAFDYVELYNTSNKIFDAGKLYIANRNSSGAISSARLLSPVPWYIFPGDYIVITEDADRLLLNYLVQHPENILAVPSLPSLPDDEGNVIILNFQGEPVDEVPYKDDWHFSLLTELEGVALERIDPFGSSQDPSNWHSAATTAGYGTPTYKNSQYRNPQGIAATIKVFPAVFSPDNDGTNDVAMIQYKIDEPGYVASITIFDATGRAVRSLARNSIMSSSGYWNWDGLNDKSQPLRAGIYIVFTEIFNSNGKKQVFKNTIVLARRLH